MDSKAVAKELVNVLRRSVEPAHLAALNHHELQAFLLSFGWNANLTEQDVPAIRDHFGYGAIITALNIAGELLEDDSNANLSQIIGQALAAITQLGNLIEAGHGPDPALPPPFNDASFWNGLTRPLLDKLTYDGLFVEAPALAAALFAVGILDTEQMNPVGPGRVPFVRYHVKWESLGDLITQPDMFVAQTYQWGTPTFKGERAQEAIRHVFEAFNFATRIETPLSTLRDQYFAAGNPAVAALSMLKVPIVLDIIGQFDDFAELGFQVMPIPPIGQPNAAPQGIMLAPLVHGAITLGAPVDDETPIKLSFKGGFETDAAFRVEILPQGLSLGTGIAGTSINAELSLSANPAEPILLIGSPESHRLELHGFKTSLGVRGPVNGPEIYFEAGTGPLDSGGKLRFVLQFGEGDGFIKTILGTDPINFDLQGALTWSSVSGLGFSGAAGFSIEVPLNLAIGPIKLDALRLASSVSTGGQAKIGAGLLIGAKLGPIALSVEEIGVQLKLGPSGPGHPALFGNLAVDFAFQPPKGVGLSVNAGVVKGGGYLFIDVDKGEYAGALELTFAEFLSLKAIGIITTKKPDGSDGFSMLVIITAEFGTGLQLGFGFTLKGVGGLIGVNRTVMLEALAAGVRTGAVSNILFPQNVIANAPRIISDLRTIFPPQDGRFLIGPMAKLGWGTPTLVSLSLGVIIEVPGNIAILGVLRVALPTEDEAVLVLQVSFIGAIEFDRKRLYFFASLFGSRILFITIDGEMGVLAAFGDDANFVLSIGGFHPRFQAPALPFPVPARISLCILNESWGRIRAEGYFAVTPNTVQFGSNVDIFFGLSDLNIQGAIGYDALFQFQPFAFRIDFHAHFSVRVFGVGAFSVSVTAFLEGPTPWHIEGHASISLLFFDIPININETWGDSIATNQPTIGALGVLVAELNKRESWRTLLPQGAQDLVTLRKPGGNDNAPLLLHPTGSLSISQRKLPLDLDIDKIGNQPTDDGTRFHIEVTAGTWQRKADQRESFARAEYVTLTSDQKLSVPAFEDYAAGIQIAPAGLELATSVCIKRVARYETTIVDTAFKQKRQSFFALHADLATRLGAGNAAALSSLSARSREQSKPFAGQVKAMTETFAIAHNDDNRVFGVTAHFASQGEAQDHMEAQFKLNPALRGTLQVVPRHELAA